MLDHLPYAQPGVLELDADNDLLRCGVCGEWRRSLASHLRMAHGLSVAEYRQLAGLNRQTRLMSPGLRAVIRQRSAPLIARLRAEGKLRRWDEDPEKWRADKTAAVEAIREGLSPEAGRHKQASWDEERRRERGELRRQRNLAGLDRATPEAISAGLKRHYAEHPEAAEANRERLKRMARMPKASERTARDAVCPRCGEVFRAASHRDKYCLPCRPEAEREYQREWKRRRRAASTEQT